MKNITFSADENLIAEARQHARQKQTTLNEAFRVWLAEYARGSGMSKGDRIRQTLAELGDSIKTHGPYTRDEMNAR